MKKTNRNKIGLVLSGLVATLVLASVSVGAEGTNTVGAPPVIIKQPKSVAGGEKATFGGEGSKDWVVQCSESVKMDLIYIQPGTFTMGSPEDELGRHGDETQHTVTLTQGYWLGKYEVTQAQWEAVMGSNPASGYGVGDNYPVYYVSWNMIMRSEGFCAKLNAQERAAGRLPEGYEYTLPTEAQWEYACRAGTTTALNSGKNLTSTSSCPNMNEVGWYASNSDSKTHEVGQKLPNAWGLYDMHGNVSEWCKDWYDDYPTGAVSDPTDSTTGSYRVVRGGSWYGYASICRSAFRYGDYPSGGNYGYGFRLALSPVQ